MNKIFSIILILIATNAHSQLFLNEAQSSNSSTMSDNMGEYDDWIEIFNSSSLEIEIGGLILKDQIDTWMIPTGNPATLIPPGGFFILWADDQEEQGDFHTNFKLSAANGEFLGLYENDGITVIDSITLPPMQADQSYINCGSTDWFISDVPSPNSVNDCSMSTLEYDGLSNNIFSYYNIDSQTLSIKIEKGFDSHMPLKIHTIDGRLVKEYTINSGSTDLNLNDLDFGTYILFIQGENTGWTNKIVLGH